MLIFCFVCLVIHPLNIIFVVVVVVVVVVSQIEEQLKERGQPGTDAQAFEVSRSVEEKTGPDRRPKTKIKRQIFSWGWATARRLVSLLCRRFCAHLSLGL